MTTILLDTNAYSQLKRGQAGVATIMRKATRVLLSAVVAGELLYGFRRGTRFERNWRDLESFLENPFVAFLPVTLETADRFSRIASGLRAKGTPIPTNDIWIAAHAMEAGATLVSEDRHFEQVDGLVWAAPAS